MLTVNPAELHGMLTDLQRSAGVDGTLPFLEGVLFHVDTVKDCTVLVGTSTNRYIIGQAHTFASGELPVTFLANVQIKQLLNALKAYVRNEKLMCELTRDGDALTAKLPGDLVLPALTITVKAGDGAGFPKVAQVFDSEIAAGIEALAFNGRFIAAVSAISRRRNDQLRIALTHNKKPSHFYIGAHYKAMVMPTGKDETGVAPTFLPPAEASSIPAIQPAA